MAIADKIGTDVSGYEPVIPPPASSSQIEQPLIARQRLEVKILGPEHPRSFPVFRYADRIPHGRDDAAVPDSRSPD